MHPTVAKDDTVTSMKTSLLLEASIVMASFCPLSDFLRFFNFTSVDSSGTVFFPSDS